MFCVIMSCNIIRVYWHFRGTWEFCSFEMLVYAFQIKWCDYPQNRNINVHPSGYNTVKKMLLCYREQRSSYNRQLTAQPLQRFLVAAHYLTSHRIMHCQNIVYVTWTRIKHIVLSFSSQLALHVYILCSWKE